ncbi:hypothetical protein C8R46DRAFT_1206692 [Mycena filopes]|nr:hypothetical protein C8R46DRAFT_1206692 [Mycena filopes]
MHPGYLISAPAALQPSTVVTSAVSVVPRSTSVSASTSAAPTVNLHEALAAVHQEELDDELVIQQLDEELSARDLKQGPTKDELVRWREALAHDNAPDQQFYHPLERAELKATQADVDQGLACKVGLRNLRSASGPSASAELCTSMHRYFGPCFESLQRPPLDYLRSAYLFYLRSAA